MPRGEHFAAFEQAELLVENVRAFRAGGRCGGLMLPACGTRGQFAIGACERPFRTH